MEQTTLDRHAPKQKAGAAVAGSEPSILAEIVKPWTALAVWRRPLAPGLAAWLDAIPAQALPHRRFVAPRREVDAMVAAACADLPVGPQRQALIDDVVELSDRFSEIMAAPTLRVRLEAIEGDACRRFHQDAVEARLLCTYRGPATEWGYADPGETPEEIHALERGDAALCKGLEWRGAPAHRLAHRSPPIAGTGRSRLLLVIDAATPAEDAEWAAHGPARG